MSFSTQPKSGPNINNPAGASARDRAVAALEKLSQAAPVQAQEHPVKNPNQITPEEMSAIAPQKGQDDKVESDPAVASDATPPKEAKPAEPKPSEEPLSAQYAQLARKEKAQRMKVQADEARLKQREDAIKAREAELTAKDTEYQTKYIPKDRLAQDPLSTLAEQGLSYEQLTDLALKGGKPVPTQAEIENQKIAQQLRDEVKAIREEQQKAAQEFKDQQKLQYDQAISQIRNETKRTVESNPEFETIKETGSVEDVVELIKQTFEKDGVLLTVEEAAMEVENHLVEEAMKIARIKKIQLRLNPPKDTAAEAKQAAPVEQSKQQQPNKTLTNNMGSSRRLTTKERAVLAFKGEKF